MRQSCPAGPLNPPIASPADRIPLTQVPLLSEENRATQATQGGPGYQTMVPGVEIYRLAFLDQRIGQASALAVFLTVLVLLVVWPIQRLGRTD